MKVPWYTGVRPSNLADGDLDAVDDLQVHVGEQCQQEEEEEGEGQPVAM